VSRRRSGYARRSNSTDLTVAEHLAVTELQADMLLTIYPQLRTTASDVVPADFEDLFTSSRPRPRHSGSGWWRNPVLVTAAGRANKTPDNCTVGGMTNR